MTYLNQLQKTGTMSAVELQTRQFNNPRPTKTEPSDIDTLREQLMQMQTTLLEQKNKLERFLTINQNRMMTLEKEVTSLKEELNKKSDMLTKMSDKEVVQKSREALFNRKDRAPLDRPIDRNNVAPSKVQIENIFNCSGKKF